MKRLIIPFLFVACLFMTACSNDDEPVVPESIIGSWDEQYPPDLQTDGFIRWNFNLDGSLIVTSVSVWTGDIHSEFDYTISEDDKTLTIGGEIKNAEGEMVRDNFVVYDVVKLTKDEMQLHQTWVNTAYDDLAPEDKNSFLLGSWKDVTFTRLKSFLCGTP